MGSPDQKLKSLYSCMAHVRWQAPRPSGGFVWPLWRCAAENAYFKLFKHATPALVNEPFQIVLKGYDLSRHTTR